MVYKKYVYRDGKRIGPYYYHSYRQGSKVKKVYIGGEEEYDGWKRKNNKKESGSGGRKRRFTVLFSIILLVAIGVFFIYIYNSSVSGRAVLNIKESYLELKVKNGELIPLDAKFVITQGNDTSEIPVSEFISSNANGSFFVENRQISGEGDGYGFLGEKTIYPKVYFILVLKSIEGKVQQQKHEKKTGNETSETTEQVTENETQETPPEGQVTGNETQEAGAGATETPTQAEQPSQPAEETTATETTPAAEVTQQETTATAETPTQETTEQAQETQAGETQVTTASESASSEASSSESAGSGGESAGSESGASSGGESAGSEASSGEAGITGGAVAEGEQEWQASVSADEPFELNLANQEAYIEGEVYSDYENLSVGVLNLGISENKAVVTTKYSKTLYGFGSEYLGAKKSYVDIELERLRIKPESGILDVKLVYQGIVLAEVSEEIKVSKKENKTVIERAEDKELQEKTIPEIEIVKNMNYTLDLEDYFEPALNYSFSETENIIFSFDRDSLLIVPDFDFTGKRESKIEAFYENRSVAKQLNINVIEIETAILNKTNETVAVLNETNETVILNQTNATIVTGNATITTKQYKAVINRRVKWVRIVEIEDESGNLVEVPKSAENIVIKTGDEVQKAIEDADNSENVIEQTDRKDIVEGGVTGAGGITGQVSLEIKTKGGAIQKFIDWVRGLFMVGMTGNVISEIDSELVLETSDSKMVDVGGIAGNETEIAVEYYTEAPVAVEEDLSSGKRVTITGPDSLNYTDILAYSELDNVAPVNSSVIRLIWHATYEDAVRYGYVAESEEIVSEVSNEIINNSNNLAVSEGNNSAVTGNVVIDANLGSEAAGVLSEQAGVDVSIPFDAYDLDEDGNIDYIEWLVPHLSQQVYEIIYITKAVRLDADRNFVEDVYDYVKAKDDNWTTINSGEYLRVTFEKMLDNTKDITLYARGKCNNFVEINGQNVSCEIYEKKKRVDELKKELGE